MKIQEINQLRKDGELLRAYTECAAVLAELPDDRYGRICMMWCLKALCDKAVEDGRADEFCKYFSQLPDLRLDELGEQDAANRFTWDIFVLFKAYANNYGELSNVASTLFVTLKKLQFLKPQKYYTVLLEAFVKVKDSLNAPWHQFVEFMDWWGFDNFLPEDFNRIPLKQAHRSIPSVAERAYSAYYKSLAAKIETGEVDAAKIDEFISRLDRVSVEHPDFTYTLYHKTLLLLSLGRRDAALEALRPFVKKKQGDFWVWDILADTTDDADVKLSCYCRALTCKADEKYLGKVKAKLARLLIAASEYPAAKCEIQQMLALYQREQWHVSQAILDLASQPWFDSTEAPKTNAAFYAAHLANSEGFLFMDSPETPILITHYNNEKRICNFVTIDHRRGFFHTAKLKCRFEPNHVMLVRFADEIKEGKAATVVTCRPDAETAPYEGVFFRHIHGALSIRYGNTFGFVDDVFVDASLAKDVADRTPVNVAAVISYNVKKERWGWRAIQLSRQ